MRTSSKTGDTLPILLAGEVHVWQFDAAETGHMLAAAVALLQPAELERRDRMRAGVARDEFALGRACLRVLLAEALGCFADEVRIAAGADGKPFVAEAQAAGLHFNVAHSAGCVLIALCRGARVGIDVECVDPHVEILEIARANFAPGEVRAIEAAGSARAGVRTFYEVWTGKEAVLKAHGTGLLTPLDSFDLRAPGPAGLGTGARAGEEQVCRLPSGVGSDSYHLQTLPLEEPFLGALAVSAPGFRLKWHRLPAEAFAALLDRALAPAACGR